MNTQMLSVVVAYKNSKKYNSIFKIFREYFVGLLKENFNGQEYYILPDFTGFNRVLYCINSYINNDHIFKYDYYIHSYNPFTNIHSYCVICPLNEGIKLPPIINITSDDIDKSLLLLED
jgi:hypothetical protein